ncbi:MAG: ATP-binding protein [Myxococcota bacterium]|nr:ATP-binding protein [Myxococcota bacterium]
MIPRRDKDRCQYADFQASLAAETLPGVARVSSFIAAVSILAFVPIDYLFYPELWLPFGALRVVCAVGQLLAGQLLAPRRPMMGLLVLTGLTGAALLVVTAATGGATSPYYSGLLVLYIALPVLIPLTAGQTFGVLGALTLGFGALPLLETAPIEWRGFGLHLVFLVLASGVATAAAGALDRMRFADYRRRREVESARDALAQLDDVKTRFTANLHHELRTPLTLMLAPLEGIRSGDYGEVAAGVERPLRTMQTNGKRLLKLISNLLDLAKLESQQFEIRRAPLEIGELMASVVEGASPLAERKDLQLGVDVEPGVPSIHADADALEKVLVNLVGNALKFTGSGGRIVVGVRSAVGGIEGWVRDTGIGLAPEQIERVFDRFAQVDASATREHEGTGIGLSLSTELVELHGGRIWAESEGLGHGTSMCFFLPTGECDAVAEESVLVTATGGAVAIGSSIELVEAELGLETAGLETRYVELDRSADRWEQRHAARSEAPPAAPEVADPGRRPILVVDDNADMRELIGFILGREFAVHLARSGREALDMLEQLEPDLVVSDIMMPEMSGTELCRAIKQDRRLRDIPVMLVSSKAESEMKIEGLELGADDYVTKPFHPRELLARARSHAALRRTRLELTERNRDLERALEELRQAEAQLVQSERLAAVGELAAGIAHEVNNPVNYALNAVRALSATVEELRVLVAEPVDLDLDDGAELETRGAAPRERVESTCSDDLGATVVELSGIVSAGLERTQRLVSQLRDFAAPGAGESGPVDLCDGIRSTGLLMRHDLEKAGVELSLELPDALQTVHGDGGALNQLLLNLVKNAAEAMEGRGGTITVAVREHGGELEVEVRDNGVGIADDVRPHLFDPFFTTKAAGQGSGLGLSMCRRIADSHGGRLAVESRVGEGSCFTLTLPIADAAGSTT